MRILALESSGQAGSIAAAEGPRLVADLSLDPEQRSARSLAPGIRQLLVSAGWKMTDLELVAVVVGPGSFTGLRVGVATAKTLAYALGARCVGLNTLEVIAAQCSGEAPQLSVAMDAQRGQVFAARYERVEADWQMVAVPTVVDNDQWLQSLGPGIAVSGPALVKLAKHVSARVTIVAADDWEPRAATVAALAWRRHLADAYDDLWRLAPLYLRKSAAEEKLEQRHDNRMS